MNDNTNRATIMLGYDDIYSIQYFNQNLAGMVEERILKQWMICLKHLHSNTQIFIQHAMRLINNYMTDAIKAGGETYAKLCVMAYRQSLAAHKLVRGAK